MSAANQRPPVSRHTATASSAIRGARRRASASTRASTSCFGQQDLERAGASLIGRRARPLARRRRRPARRAAAPVDRRRVAAAAAAATLAAGASAARAAQGEAGRRRDGRGGAADRRRRRAGRAPDREVDLQVGRGERGIEDRGHEAGASRRAGCAASAKRGDLAGHTLALGVEQSRSAAAGRPPRGPRRCGSTPETASVAWPSSSDGSACTCSMTRPVGFTGRPIAA